MVQTLEELRESGAVPYSNAPCALVSLASTSLAWSDRPVPQLRPLQLLLPDCVLFSCSAAARVHPLVITHMQYKYNKPTHTIQIYHYACCYILIWVVGWAYF